MNVRTAIEKLPPIQNRNVVLFSHPADNSDIISTLHKYFPEAIRQTKQIAESFRGRSITESASKIWHWLKANVQYIPDGEDEQWIRLPNVLVSTGRGDCKSYALFINSVLANLGYPAIFRYVSFDRHNATPTHVYAITKDHGQTILIDPVYDSFNAEQPYQSKRDVKMQVGVMTGLGYDPQLQRAINDAKLYLSARPFVNGIGKVTFKKVALAIPRNSFLALVFLNAFNIAGKLNEAIAKNPSIIQKVWNKLGGDYSKLKNTVTTGARKKALLGLYGIGDVASITALLSTGAAVIAAVGPVIKAATGDSKAADDLQKAATLAGGVSDIVTTITTPQVAEGTQIDPIDKSKITWSFIEYNGYPARDARYIKIWNTGKIISVPEEIRSQIYSGNGGAIVSQWLKDAGYIKSDIHLQSSDGSQLIVTDPEPGSGSSEPGQSSSLIPLLAGGFIAAKIFSIF